MNFNIYMFFFQVNNLAGKHFDISIGAFLQAYLGDIEKYNIVLREKNTRKSQFCYQFFHFVFDTKTDQTKDN